MKKLTADVLVVGGGAAGMMAAGTAARADRNRRILLLEHSRTTGLKLLITGKGRCNVTNNCSVADVLQNIPRNPRFLQSALHAFPPSETISFFEELGVPLKIERGNRVFPISDRSDDIVAALQQWLFQAGVKQYGGSAQGLIITDQTLRGVRTAQGDTILANRVILATGGCSYPRTGSDGSGYALARQAGHNIIEPQGSLVPLQEDGDCCARLQGLSLRNVAIKLVNSKGEAVYTDFGELLFTHYGLSGPTVLSASAHMKTNEEYTFRIDLKPALDEKTLDRRLLRDFDEDKNKNLDNVLRKLFPRTLIPVILERTGLSSDTKVHCVTRSQRCGLLQLTKSFDIRISGKRPVSEAIVTSGGVDVRQVDPKTMQSRLLPGLFFAGELLDVDAYTGGFNLQIAWATGYAAGSHV